MKESTKEGFGKALLELGEKKDIIVLAGRADKFAEKFPQKFIQCSADTIGIATGIALQGKTVFAEAQEKSLDKIRNACLNNADVKIIGTENISLQNKLPITIIIPADSAEAQKAAIAAAITKGPAYIQISREKTPTITKDFVLGRAEILRAGEDCTIVACGKMLHEALAAAEKLAKQDIECTVINNHTLKPMDKNTILASTRITKCIVASEELGSTVAETISQHNPVPVRITGGTYKEIIRTVKEAIRQKCENVKEEAGVSPELRFKVHDGSTISSIAGLQKALIHMDDIAFAHHVNENKNDFASWVKDVFKDEALANQAAKRKTKLSIASLLANRK